MKRLNEKVEGNSQNLGFKKGRFTNGNGESCEDLETSKKQAISENDSSSTAKFIGIVPDNSDGPNRKESSECCGNEKGQRGLGFDINSPLLGTSEKNIVEIIEISSDSSDNEAEFGGSNVDCEAKSKETEVGMLYDRMENLNVKLGIPKNTTDNVVDESTLVTGGEQKSDLIDLNVPLMEIVDIESRDSNNEAGFGTIVDNVVSESSLAIGGKQRYTREQKGKAIVGSNPGLSQKSDSIDLNVSLDSEQSVVITEPTEDVVIRSWQPESRPELPERAPSIITFIEHAQRIIRPIRSEYDRQRFRARAQSLARASPDENDGNKSISQTQIPPTVEQLGIHPGPFAEALEKVRQRTLNRTSEHLIKWKPSTENKDRSITAPLVPSLLDLSLKVLAKNAEAIVSLEHIPYFLRRRLVDLLCDMRKINASILNLLVKGCPTQIRIKNCSWLTQENLQQSLASCQTQKIKVLQLDLCGQCMFDYVFGDALARSLFGFSSLSIVSLRGACCLSDSELKVLVTSAPVLRSINLGQCSLLTCDAVNFIADSLGSNLRELYIDGCPKIDAAMILPDIKKFTFLEVLSVAGSQTVTDQFLSEVISVCGQSIKELDLAYCLNLSDLSLKTIGSSCAGLCSLNIENLHNLSDLGMEYLANGCRSIQKLKLSRNGFSDEAMAAFLESSGESLVELSLNKVTKVGSNTALSLAIHSRKLLSLDISWCRRISNEALGLIVDSCWSLKLLKIFGCRQITSVFLNGHSNPLVQIIGIPLTPVLNHLNLFQPEKEFLQYSPLPDLTED